MVYADGRFTSANSGFSRLKALKSVKFFFELYAIAMIDEEYHDAEKILVEPARERFNISNDKVAAMSAALKTFLADYKTLRKVVLE